MLSRSSIFTIPDKELVSDGAVDPMGMQMIWTYFGQLIFQNKLTTVSTDIRNYTINLLHHYVLYRFQNERSEEFFRGQQQFGNYRNAYDTKAGIIIFMEDLLTYALMDQKGPVDTSGLLGSNNGQDALDRSNEDYSTIEIHAEKAKGVLVRQIQLGVNGRYKGPFMNMGLMSTNFEYSPIEFERIEILFKHWPEGSQLVDKLLDLISELFQHDSKDYPVVGLNRYREDANLWTLYANCFGKVQVNEKLKHYWQEKLGVTAGAAQSIFSEIPNLGSQPIPAIIASAHKNEDDEKQREILQWVLDLEPFLTRCSHAFYLMADVSVKNIQDLKSDFNQLLDSFPIESVLPLTGRNERLELLVDHVKDHTGDSLQFAQAILGYHKQIMEARGGVAWLELKGDQINHLIAQRPATSTQEVVTGQYWYNRYYLDAVQSIYYGLHAK